MSSAFSRVDSCRSHIGAGTDWHSGISSSSSEGRDIADVVRPSLQRETARMRHPTNAAALGVMIKQLFGEPAAVVIAGTEEKNSFHLFVLGDQSTAWSR